MKPNHRWLVGIMAAAAALPSGGGTLLAADDTDAEIQALREQIRLLDQRLQS